MEELEKKREAEQRGERFTTSLLTPYSTNHIYPDLGRLQVAAKGERAMGFKVIPNFVRTRH